MAELDSLLSQLGDLGVLLWVESGRLKYSAPAGVLTPDLLAVLKDHRDKLLERFCGPLRSSQPGTQVLHRLVACRSRHWWQHQGGQFACVACHPPTHRCTVRETNYAGVMPIVDWRTTNNPLVSNPDS